MTDDTTRPAEPPHGPPRGLRRALTALAILVAVVVGARIFIVSPPGRSLATAMIDGRSLGRFGRLGVQGLHGDILSNFTIDRVTLSDAKGVWLVGRKVQVRWSPLGLFGRTVHAQRVSAATVDILRRPQLLPPAVPGGPLPVSIEIGRFTSEVQLMPAFAKRYGRWAVAGDLDLMRSGAKRGAIEAHSLVRQGDFLSLNFDMGGHDWLKLALQAREAKGGSLAGALGYAPDQPFRVDVHADSVGQRGAFDATAVSGPYTPVHAHGDWTDGDGRAQGVIAFAGSDLLKPFSQRLGPQAAFQLAFQRRADGRYDTTLSAQTDNLDARGQGVVALRPFGAPSGVRLKASTASLSRLIGRRLAGAATFDGTWRGALQDWRLAGGFTAKQAGLDGYTLAGVAGPVQVRFAKGRIDGEGRLQGEGGAGRGLFGGLLGARPKGGLALARLPDGRLILQQFDVDGADLSVHGRGARGLTGAFSFEGKAEIPRLAAVRKGAGGALAATWRAAETGRGRPWSVAFIADGRNFASGLGQLDRLLGHAPKLTAAGEYAKGVVRVNASTLTGQAGQAKAKGTVALNGALDLKLDWNAQGPFQAGPVTLAGNARGSGGVTGQILHPKVELTSSFERIDLPELTLQHALVDLAFARDPSGYDGQISVKAGSAWGPAQAQSRFAFSPAGVRLEQLSLDAGGVKAHGAVTLSRSGPSDADLTFAAGPGAFLTAGSAHGTIRLTDAAAAQAAVEVEGVNVAFRNAPYTIQSLRLAGHGALDHLPFSLSATIGGSVPASFEGSGVYGRNGAAQTVSLTGSGKLHSVAYRTLSPLVVGLSPGVRTLSADIGVGRGRVTASVREAQDGLTARGNVAGLELAALDTRLSGELEGAMNVTGKGAQLSGTLDSRLSNVQDKDAPEAGALSAQIRATLAGNRLQLAATGRDTKGGNAVAQVDLPVAASATPLHLAIARTQPISGRFSVQGEAGPYWMLVAGGENSLTGQLAAQGTIGGTLAAPSISGTANLQKAAFEDARTGLQLRDMAMTVDFSHEAAVVQTFKGDDGHGGTITGQGRVNLARGGDSSFTLELRRFEVLNRDEASARASGPVTVTRAADGHIKLAGKLRVDRAEISPNPPTPSGVVRLNVIEINKPAGRGQDYAPPNTGPPIELDISLDAPGQVLVQGRGLNLELSMRAHVGGTTRDPSLTGVATVVRGDYTFAGKRFDVSPGGVINLSTHVDDIRLNLEAVYNPPAGGLTATVYVRGTAAHPDISITSSPSLPQDEILSQILFGSSATQLSTTQAAQIGAATASLATGGGMDVLNNLSRFAGLDVLSFGTVGSSLAVTGGKYVGSNLYLEVVGGGQGGTSVQADWRALKNFSIVSQIAGQGYSRISIYWRKDFH